MRGLIVLLLVTSACFQSPRHRRYAKIGEGILLAGGVALSYAASTNGCGDRRPGTTLMECDRSVGQLGTVGLIAIFAGLAGFAATMITENASNDSSDDEPSPSTTRDERVFAPPAGFCPSMWAGDLPQAEAALATYVKSVGAAGVSAAGDALHDWLSRQACVVVEDDAEDVMLSIRIRVSVREVVYRVDFSASPFIVLIAE